MLHSLRSRLIATIIGLVVVTAVLLSTFAYLGARRSLRSQLVESAVTQAEFNIVTLATDEVLPGDADLADFEATGLGERFLRRGTAGVVVEFAAGEPYTSSFELQQAPIPPQLREIVASGNLGWHFAELAGQPVVIVGGRRPPTGPDFYFFRSAAEVEAALSRLLGILIGAGIVVTAVGALVAGMVARRVLRPVGTASEAAARMAAGDLSVRIPGDSTDEIGRWAESFNSMAASLQGKIADLEEASARERRFVADVSHELRTPVTALINEAALLAAHLEQQPVPDEDRRIAAMLAADTGRLRTLVEDLLEISRLDAGAGGEALREVDIAGFLGALVGERSPGAELTISGPPGRVETDPRALERIVGNLLDNSAQHAAGRPVSVEAILDEGRLRIEVADSGPGVVEEDVPRLFDRFYKADRSRQGGSGLGLSVAREHARRLGGDLTTRNATAGGMVFTLEIPVTRSLPDGDVAENPGEQDGSVDADRYEGTQP